MTLFPGDRAKQFNLLPLIIIGMGLFVLCVKQPSTWITLMDAILELKVSANKSILFTSVPGPRRENFWSTWDSEKLLTSANPWKSSNLSLHLSITFPSTFPIPNFKEGINASLQDSVSFLHSVVPGTCRWTGQRDPQPSRAGKR